MRNKVQVPQNRVTIKEYFSSIVVDASPATRVHNVEKLS